MARTAQMGTMADCWLLRGQTRRKAHWKSWHKNELTRGTVWNEGKSRDRWKCTHLVKMTVINFPWIILHLTSLMKWNCKSKTFRGRSMHREAGTIFCFSNLRLLASVLSTLHWLFSSVRWYFYFHLPDYKNKPTEVLSDIHIDQCSRWKVPNLQLEVHQGTEYSILSQVIFG